MRSRSWIALVSLIGFGLLIPLAAAETPFDPEAYDLQFSKGVLAFSETRYADAEKFFAAALEAKPGDPEASDFLGQSLIRLKRFGPAETVFRRILEADPDSGRAHLGLGVVHYNRGRYEEALASLLAAQQRLPDDPLVHFYQGLVYHAREDFDKSPGRFLKAMTLSRDLAPSAQYYSGLAYFKRGVLDEAKAAFEEVVASGEPESEFARSARQLLAQLKTTGAAAPKRWDIVFSASLQYDSNVVLLPLGTQPPGGTTGISRRDDYRHSLFFRGEYRPIQTDNWTAGAAYGVYQSFHSTLTTFDVEDHAPLVFVQRQLGPIQARLQYVFDYVKVGQAPYLISHSIQPMMTISEGGRMYTLVQMKYQHKDFQHGFFRENSLRDGKNWLLGASQYVLFANNTGSVRLGLTYDTDRTGGGSPAVATPGVQTNADWAYDGYLISSGITLPPVRDLKFDLAFDYYRQNYDNPNSFSPGGNVRRRDNIFFLTGTLTRDLTTSLSLAFQYSYTRDQSNVSAFDYNRSVYSVLLAGHF